MDPPFEGVALQTWEMLKLWNQNEIWSPFKLNDLFQELVQTFDKNIDNHVMFCTREKMDFI